MTSILLISLERTRERVLRRAIAQLGEELGEELFDLDILIESDAVLVSRDDLLKKIHSADIIITSHILTDDLVDHILVGLATHPKHFDFFPFSSSGRLMRSVRVGSLSFGEIQTTPRAEKNGNVSLSRIRSLLLKIADEDKLAERLKDLMTLAPKILRFIPGASQGMRYFLESYIAWLEPTDENTNSLLKIFLRLNNEKYSRIVYRTPSSYASEGIYDWRTQQLFFSLQEYQNDRALTSSPIVGVLVPRNAISSNDTNYIHELARKFINDSIEVIIVFSETFDARKAIDTYLTDASGHCIVDLLLSMTGFPLVGGHIKSEPQAASDALSALDIPYISAITLTHQRKEDWLHSREGLSAIQVVTNISLTELDGAIEPIVIASSDGEDGKQLIEENANLLVERIKNWLTLGKKSNRDKKIAVVIFCFPPARGAVGTAAYLDVFTSLHTFLKRLQSEGYSVNIPVTKEQLLNDIIGSDSSYAMSSTPLNVAATMTVPRYKNYVPRWKEAEREWGAPPGEINTDGEQFLIQGIQYGNVFVGVQPGFGYEGDPMRLLFTKNATPHHGFLAFYAHLKKQFQADAVVHFGTHGALEFMPGKHNGLSSECWSQELIGSLPNIYLYAVNNPSEATIAKRRSYATTVSYLTPTNSRAGLYRSLESLKNCIDEYRSSLVVEGLRQSALCETLIERAHECHLEYDSSKMFPQIVDELSAQLTEISQRLIPLGLRIIGETPKREEQIDLLEELARFDRRELDIQSLDSLLQESKTLDAVTTAEPFHFILSTLAESGLEAATLALKQYDLSRNSRASAEKTLHFLSEILDRMVLSDEITPLVRALDGKYIPPSPGGDLLRVPAALPVGRNITALNPYSIPTAVALSVARISVAQLLARAQKDSSGRIPECIGLILWGLDNIKTGGEAIAQAFLLLGVEVRPDALGNMTKLRVIPYEELQRPRIDVVFTVSGIFRDIFAHQMSLLDEAVKLVALLDETPEKNFIRKHHLELQSKGFRSDESLYRVFSNASGSYGTNVDYMVMSNNWTQQRDLADIFSKRKGFSFGKHREEIKATEIFRELAGYIDTTYQNLDSSEIGISDVDHYYEYLGGLTNLAAVARGVKPNAYVADTTTATPVLRSLEETIRLEAQTKSLNPKWYEAMMKHGFEGVEEIKKRVDYTYGWSATAQAVPSWFYDEIHESYIRNEELRGRMQQANPDAFHAMTERLTEAHSRGYWEATSEQLQELSNAASDAEEIIEGVDK